MWQMVELSELRLFLEVAERRSFRRAAEAVGVTPSRASQVLRNLEAKIGTQLVHRTSRRVALSPAGEALRQAIAEPYDALQRALAEAHRASSSIAGELRLGLFSPADAGPHLYGVVDTFERRHAPCRVVVLDLLLRMDGIDALLEGVVDVAAARLPVTHPDVVVGPTLDVEPRVLAVARHHPLAGRDQVSIEEVADYAVAPLQHGFRRELVDGLVPPVTPSGRPIRRVGVEVLRHASDDTLPIGPSHIAALVARGEIVHPTVPTFGDNWGHPHVVYVPLTGLPPSRTALVYARRSLGPTVRAFLDVATEVLAGQLG
jgi:DNA-binding transcriptional LysR family regulator